MSWRKWTVLTVLVAALSAPVAIGCGGSSVEMADDPAPAPEDDPGAEEAPTIEPPPAE